MFEAFGSVCAEQRVMLEMEEVDLLRNRESDLSKEELQWHFRQAVLSGEYDVVLVTPPCGLFSRLLWANRRGPCPVRSQHFPRAFPWLEGPDLRRAQLGNKLADFALQLAADVAEVNAKGKHHVLVLGEHPEDLGRCKAGLPGSMFQWPAYKELIEVCGFVETALHQSDLGAPTPKPTRLWGNFY